MKDLHIHMSGERKDSPKEFKEIRIGSCGSGFRVGQLIRESRNACNIDSRAVAAGGPDILRASSPMRTEERDAKLFRSSGEMLRPVKPDALIDAWHTLSYPCFRSNYQQGEKDHLFFTEQQNH